MKALVWHGRNDVRCDTVPNPRVEASREAIVNITSTAICGSDLHLYDGTSPPWSWATCWGTNSWARWSR